LELFRGIEGVSGRFRVGFTAVLTSASVPTETLLAFLAYFVMGLCFVVVVVSNKGGTMPLYWVGGSPFLIAYYTYYRGFSGRLSVTKGSPGNPRA
jgi:1,4-dihydroxy-2-naphthoate octaprenyltransferase